MTRIYDDLEPYSLVKPEAWLLERSRVKKLDWNELYRKPSPAVGVALIEYFSKDYLNWYPDICQSDIVRALSEHLKIQEESILVTAGSDSGHELIIERFISESSRVLIVSPAYDNFRVTLQSRTRNIDFWTFVNEDRSFRSIGELKSFIGHSHYDMVYLVNPNNPMGTCYNREDLLELVSFFNETLFLIDEAYVEFSRLNCQLDFELPPNVFFTRTFSKAYGLASLRIGYILAKSSLISKLRLFYNAKSTSMPAQIGALSALQDQQYLLDSVGECILSRDRMYKALKDNSNIYCYPSEGNFVMFEFYNIKHKKAFLDFCRMNQIFIRDIAPKTLNGYYVRYTCGDVDADKLILNFLLNEI